MPQKKRKTKRVVVHARPAVPIREHAKRIWHVTPKFVHGAVAGAVIGIVVVSQLGSIRPAHALSIDTPRDCDDYAVIRCGSLTTGELKKDYNTAGVADIYNHFGISASDINTIDTVAVMGTVYDSGKIMVKDKVVATDAITAARLNVNGSSKVHEGGTTFYVRHLKISWSHKQAPAYVVMKNGEFKFAILASCGNPLIGNAVPAPKPTPQPTPPPASTKPKPTPPSPQPLLTPPPLTITPSAAPEVLPNTGPGALIIIAAASVLGGLLAHHTHRHIKRRRHARTQSGSVGRHAIRHSLR
jgi:hypothetical protein